MNKKRKPQTWFIRLGSAKEVLNYNLYQDLAWNYDLIQIGYGIEEDIIGKNKSGIRNYLADRNTLSLSQIGKIADLINKFINEIRIGDTIISKLENGKYKRGQVISCCGRVDSFLSDENLQEIQKKCSNAPEMKSIGIKPAIKVNWESKEITLEHFSKQLQEELRKFMPAAVNRLNDETGLLLRVYYNIQRLKYISEVKPWFEGFLSAFRKGIIAIIIPATVSSVISFFLNAYFEEILNDTIKLAALWFFIGIATGITALYIGQKSKAK